MDRDFIDIGYVSQYTAYDNDRLIQKNVFICMGLSNQTRENADDCQKCENAGCYDAAGAKPQKHKK